MPAVTRATITLLLATLFVATGCVTAPWVPTDGAYTSPVDRYAIDLPQGWMRWTPGEDGRLVVTRDGVLLQVIMIERFRVGEPLKHTKKQLARGMMPQEAAEGVLDNLRPTKERTGHKRALALLVRARSAVPRGAARGGLVLRLRGESAPRAGAD